MAAGHGELLAVPSPRARVIQQRSRRSSSRSLGTLFDQDRHSLSILHLHLHPSLICSCAASEEQPASLAPAEDRIHSTRASETFFHPARGIPALSTTVPTTVPPLTIAASPAARLGTYLVSVFPQQHRVWREQGERGERVGWICRAADATAAHARIARYTSSAAQQQTAQGTSNLAVGEWCEESCSRVQPSAAPSTPILLCSVGTWLCSASLPLTHSAGRYHVWAVRTDACDIR